MTETEITINRATYLAFSEEANRLHQEHVARTGLWPSGDVMAYVIAKAIGAVNVGKGRVEGSGMSKRVIVPCTYRTDAEAVAAKLKWDGE